MIGIYHTTRQPMRDFVDRMKALERKAPILSVSLIHGFPWNDVPELGTKLIVISDAAPAEGTALAAELGRELSRLRGETAAPQLDYTEAVRRAGEMAGPVVIADTADNVGGGAPGDSTFLVGHLLANDIGSVAIGPFWDPIAVSLCLLAGPGARLALRLGGKMGPTSGPPLDVMATVLATRPGFRTAGASEYDVSYGDCAAIRTEGIDIVLVSAREQALSPAMFTELGVILSDKQIVVVKSSQHFHAGFAPIAREILYATSPGALAADFTALTYTKVKRPIWPLDPISRDSALSE